MTIADFYNNTRVQWIVFTVVLLLTIGLFVYKYKLGEQGNRKGLPTYEFFSTLFDGDVSASEKWQNFRRLLANIGENFFEDAIGILLVMLLPMPGISTSISLRYEVVLAKLGIFAILLFLIVGKPSYEKTLDTKTTRKQEVAKWLLLLFFIVPWIFYFIAKR